MFIRVPAQLFIKWKGGQFCQPLLKKYLTLFLKQVCIN